LRLLLKLSPKKSHVYMNDYHYHLQAAVYSLIRDGGLPDLHEKKGYKFFCFSNIFPFGDFRMNEEKRLLISSPSSEIISAIADSVRRKAETGDELKVGDMVFSIGTFEGPFRLNLQRPKTVVKSETPIVIRIPKYRLPHDVRFSRYKYVYWRETLPPSYFVSQLIDNAEKKLKELRETRGESNLTESFNADTISNSLSFARFLRTVSKKVSIRGSEHLIIGSLWECGFIIRSDEDAQVLESILDCGLGERNSLGFGFCNVKAA
jgi:CRISPR-associated endoribonuclease Cas6